MEGFKHLHLLTASVQNINILICGGRFQSKIKGLVLAMQSIGPLSANDPSRTLFGAVTINPDYKRCDSELCSLHLRE
jgi:hypothetical protein